MHVPQLACKGYNMYRDPAVPFVGAGAQIWAQTCTEGREKAPFPIRNGNVVSSVTVLFRNLLSQREE